MIKNNVGFKHPWETNIVDDALVTGDVKFE
jgi:hypothetical protein